MIDERRVETGSFDNSASAARSNWDNVLVVWNDQETAAKYLSHWADRWANGIDVAASTWLRCDLSRRNTELSQVVR